MSRGIRSRRLRRVTEPREFYFVFTKGPRYMPWYLRNRLKPGFGHVMALGQQGIYGILYDLCHKGFSNKFLKNPKGEPYVYPVEFMVAALYRDGAKVIRIEWELDARPTLYHITNFFPGCVTFAKQLLGVALWVFTPYQFYQWLLANGGEEWGDTEVSEVENIMLDLRRAGQY